MRTRNAGNDDEPAHLLSYPVASESVRPKAGTFPHISAKYDTQLYCVYSRLTNKRYRLPLVSVLVVCV